MNCTKCDQRISYQKTWRTDHAGYDQSERRRAYKKRWYKAWKKKNKKSDFIISEKSSTENVMLESKKEF